MRRSTTPRRIRAESSRFRHTRRSPPRGALPAPRRARRSFPRRDPARGAAFRRARRARHDDPGASSNSPSRHAEDRARRCPERLGAGRICAAGGQRRTRARVRPPPGSCRCCRGRQPSKERVRQEVGSVYQAEEDRHDETRRSPAAGGRAPRLLRGGEARRARRRRDLNRAFPVQQEMDCSRPAASAASTRSSPSQLNSPVRSRWRRDARRRTSRSRGFDGEVITLAHPATRATGRGSPRARAEALAVGKEPGPEAPVAVLAGPRSSGQGRPAGTGGRPPRAPRRSGRDPPCPRSR